MHAFSPDAARTSPDQEPGSRGTSAREAPLYDAHPAIAAPIRHRIDYARVVASVAKREHQLGAHEVACLRRLCRTMGLPPGATEGVVLFAHDPHPERVRESLEALRDSDLQLSLLTDLIALAMSEGKYPIDARKQIHAVAAVLLVGEAQVVAIEDHVAQHLQRDMATAVLDDDDDAPEASLAGALAAALGGVLVPTAMLWLASPRGFTPSGIATALDLLGFGRGPLVGLGVDLGLGLVTYVLIRAAWRVTSQAPA